MLEDPNGTVAKVLTNPSSYGTSLSFNSTRYKLVTSKVKPLDKTNQKILFFTEKGISIKK